MDHCSICNRVLNTDEVLSLDCGGDCLGCIRDAMGSDREDSLTLHATIVELVETNCDHCLVRVRTPEFRSLLITVPEDVGRGYLADEWHGTFARGNEVTFGIDLTQMSQAGHALAIGFRHGDYQRGYLS